MTCLPWITSIRLAQLAPHCAGPEAAIYIYGGDMSWISGDRVLHRPFRNKLGRVGTGRAPKPDLDEGAPIQEPPHWKAQWQLDPVGRDVKGAKDRFKVRDLFADEREARRY